MGREEGKRRHRGKKKDDGDGGDGDGGDSKERRCSVIAPFKKSQVLALCSRGRLELARIERRVRALLEFEEKTGRGAKSAREWFPLRKEKK